MKQKINHEKSNVFSTMDTIFYLIKSNIKNKKETISALEEKKDSTKSLIFYNKLKIEDSIHYVINNSLFTKEEKNNEINILEFKTCFEPNGQISKNVLIIQNKNNIELPVAKFILQDQRCELKITNKKLQYDILNFVLSNAKMLKDKN